MMTLMANSKKVFISSNNPSVSYARSCGLLFVQEFSARRTFLLNKKESRLRDSPPAAGCFSNIFFSAAVRSLAERFLLYRKFRELSYIINKRSDESLLSGRPFLFVVICGECRVAHISF